MPGDEIRSQVQPFRGVLPFIVTELDLLDVLFAFPDLVTLLPSLGAR